MPRLLSKARHSVTLWVTALVAVVIIMTAGQTGFTLYELHIQNLQIAATHAIRQAHWCKLFDTLTSTPVEKPADPKKNPSREQAYVFYAELMGLKKSYGCGA